MNHMGFIVSIPLGIFFGYIAYQISLKNQFLSYLFAILPYSIFFWLSFENRDLWGHYRAIAFFATAVASLFCFVKRKIDKKRVKNANG